MLEILRKSNKDLEDILLTNHNANVREIRDEVKEVLDGFPRSTTTTMPM